MNCQECGKKPATLHFTKIVNGEKTEFHICESCARERGEFIPGTANGFSIHHLLSGLLDFQPKSTLGGKPAAPERCEHCGLTYNQFSKLGKFGCSQCYHYFSERLEPLLRRVHGHTVHVGKVPKRSGGRIRHQRELDQLKRELARLVEREEFEEAAKVRDQIKELERKISNM